MKKIHIPDLWACYTFPWPPPDAKSILHFIISTNMNYCMILEPMLSVAKMIRKIWFDTSYLKGQ